LIFSFKEADCLCKQANTQSPWEEQKNKNPAWFYRRMFRRGLQVFGKRGGLWGKGFLINQDFKINCQTIFIELL
jgi:hypothetical protein